MTKYTKHIYALIPARGGSESIPKKNLQILGQRTLLARAINQALACPRIHKVFVSTDCPEIREAALAGGALAPFLRPAAISQAQSPDLDAFLHWLEFLHGTEGELPRILVHLRATSPFRSLQNIEDAIRILEENPGASAVRSVSPPRQSPYKMWTEGPDGYLQPLVTLPIVEAYNLPRQSLPPTFWQSATVDAVRASVVWEEKSMTGRAIRPLLVSAKESLDIDGIEDLEYARFLESRNHK
jgi:N-acylneuraminate cytidylyltransferase